MTDPFATFTAAVEVVHIWHDRQRWPAVTEL